MISLWHAGRARDFGFHIEVSITLPITFAMSVILSKS